MELQEIRSTGKGESLFSNNSVSDVTRFTTWFNIKIAECLKQSDGDLIGASFTVTPAMAEWLLVNKNHGNRPIRKTKVASFKEAILADKFMHTSQGVAVTRTGRLINGQHRLHAIVAAGKAVKLYFVFNEQDAAFKVLDSNIGVRGGADTLHVMGHKNTAALAAAAKVLLNLENGVMNNHSIDNDEIGAFVESHPGLTDAVTAAIPIIKKLKTTTGGIAVALYYMRMSRHGARLDEFINSLVNGSNLKAKSPILVLRDGLQTRTIDDLVRHHSLRPIAQAAALISAWNLWNAGRSASIHSIKWSPDRPFPTVV